MKDLRYLNEYRIILDEFKEFKFDEKCEGMFDIVVNGKIYFVIASVDEGWQHVSVSGLNNIMPTWDVVETIKNKFFEDDEFVVEYHPKKEDYINNKENCLHIWSPLDKEMPYPNILKMKKNKPVLIKKQVVNINGEPYYYELYNAEDFEFITVQSGFKLRPDWNAVCKIKQEVFGNTVAVSYHAKKGDLLYKQNKNKPDQITVWRSINESIPTPNSEMVGVKGLTEGDLKKMSKEELLELI